MAKIAFFSMKKKNSGSNTDFRMNTAIKFSRFGMTAANFSMTSFGFML